MKFNIKHTNLNVLDLEKSLAFYQKALGMQEVRRIKPEDGSFTIVFLSDGSSEHQLELTCLHDKKEAYDLGDNETHICFEPEDYEKAYQLHKEMDCICYENKGMGLYFIEDPDGYWLEVVPNRK